MLLLRKELLSLPVPKTVQSLQKPLMREEVYAAIKKWIIEGVLQPEEKVTDGELALQLGVSRTPVREALRRLEDEGLVETARNRWTRVSPIDLEQADHIYPIISSLEALAANIASQRLGSQDFTAMREANRDLKLALQAGDSVTAAAKDLEFHSVFVAKSGNPHLIDTVDHLRVMLSRLEIAYFRGAALARSSVTEHGRILKAFRAGDPQVAADAVAQNWQKSLKRFHQQVRGHEARPAASHSGGSGNAK
jgi:DNA-binding GntR family transcriptional regulator